MPNSIVVSLQVFVLVCLASIAFAASASATPTIDRAPTRPDIVRAIDASVDTDVTFRCRRYSDWHVYSASGRPYLQVPAEHADGYYFMNRRGRIMAVIERIGRGRCVGYGLARRPMLLALWISR